MVPQITDQREVEGAYHQRATPKTRRKSREGHLQTVTPIMLPDWRLGGCWRCSFLLSLPGGCQGAWRRRLHGGGGMCEEPAS